MERVSPLIYLLLLILIGCGGEEVNQKSVDEHFNVSPLDSSPATTSSDATSLALALNLTNELGAAITNISNRSPGIVSATLLNNQQPLAGVLVRFNLSFGLATLAPASGTAITDEHGLASVIVQATDLDGAETITASIEGGSIEGGISSSLNFSVAAIASDLSMTTPTLVPAQIGAHGVATLSVAVLEHSDSVSSPYQPTTAVTFTSSCTALGLATIDSPVNTVNGLAQTTYKDIACGVTDQIQISAQVGQTLLAQTAQLVVQDAAVGSIVFSQASNNFIALQGTGGTGGNVTRLENATLTFQVFDVSGSPASFEDVNFILSSAVGGLSLNHDSATTDANGYVTVIVQSGHVPTSVRVIASMAANTSISTISDLLVISTGVADYNSFSLSASTYNVEGWDFDGIEVTITAQVADHYNNPVPDGNAVVFNTEFGQITQSCLTVNGACSVQWTSSAPRSPIPAFRDASTRTRQLGDGGDCFNQDGGNSGLNSKAYPCFYDNAQGATANTAAKRGGLGQVYGNRVTIFAYMIGEESFADTNGNGLFDTGEAYLDLASEGFRDDNEDGLFGGRLSNGDLQNEAQAASAACRAETGLVCLQAGGDNEEYVDFNNNQKYDWQGNALLNNVLCPEDNLACTKELLPIWKNITILQSGSQAAISIVELAKGGEHLSDYAESIDISDGATRTLVAYFTDLHNGRMAAGSKVKFVTTNGSIVGPDQCTVLNSTSLDFEGCYVAIKKDPLDLISDAGQLTVTVTTPLDVATESSITILD